MSRRVSGVLTVLGMLALADPSRAQQGQNAMIVGEVRDSSSGAVGNATIWVSSGSLIGGVQTAITSQTGAYRLPALAPGEYELTASAPGFKSHLRRAVILLPGATATVDFTLAPAGVSETVTVTGREPSALDVRTSALHCDWTHDPRQSAAESDGLGLREPRPRRRPRSEPGQRRRFRRRCGINPFMLDGANGNETDWGTPTTAPSQSWIEEVQVVTLGADAQFGEYTGAPMNAITRSGSNTVAGGADYWTTRPNWVANDRGSLTPALAARFRPLDVLDRWSTTAQLGGPIRTDKAWFFGGVDVYRNVNRPAGFAAIGNPPEDAVVTLTEPKWLAKATAAPRSAVRIEGYFGRTLSNSLGSNASPTTKPEALSADSRPEVLWSGRLTWVVSDRTLVEAQHGGHNTHLLSGPRDGTGLAGLPGHYDVATGIQSVNITSYRDVLTRPINSSVALTRYAAGSNGRSHRSKPGSNSNTTVCGSRMAIPAGWCSTIGTVSPTRSRFRLRRRGGLTISVKRSTCRTDGRRRTGSR